MQDFDLPPDAGIPAPPIKGRGASANVVHRYSRETRQAVADGWDSELPPDPRTRLLIDRARSILSHNDSPDLPFTQSLNPYRGCEHGCIYCYARPTHAWLDLSPGLDFETQIFAKPDAPRLLREAFARPGYQCSPIALGTATDAYQPCERKEGLCRAVLEICKECSHPVSLVTKSALVERDVDLWAALAARRLGHVALSLTTLDSTLARQLEPRASTPAARLRAMEKLAAAGVPVAVFVAPLIPGLNDQELEKILAAARQHGASAAHYVVLRLPHEVAGLFRNWLEQHAPDKAGRILSVLYDLRHGRLNDARFGSRMTGLGHFADLVRQRFNLACRRLDLNTELPALDCSAFTPAAQESHGGQLSLF